LHELDRRGAHELAHRDIARMVSDEYGVATWWTQTVTVGYERIKGLREVGQRRGGGFEASKSKTIAVPLEELLELASNARKRSRWWPGVKPERPNTKVPSVRLKATDDQPATVIWFAAKGPSKTTLTVVGSELPDRAAADRFKADWSERLARLGELAGKRG
jgi:hypothetical protein